MGAAGDGVGGPISGAGAASGPAFLRDFRASQRLKAMIAAATTPTKLRALHGVANIEASMDCMSTGEAPFLILWSRLRLVDVKCSAMVSVIRMSRVTWTVVYIQG